MQIILFIIWLIAAVFKLSYPVFSFNEMGFIPPVILHNIAPHLWWVVRLISVASIFFVIFAITKKLQLKTISLFILITSPWLFILARELNIWVDLLLIIFACILIVKKKIPFYALLAIFLIFLFFHYPPTVQRIEAKVSFLLHYIRFIKLFFRMEYASGYLHIPKTGYFPYVTLPLFILGLMDKKIYRVILPFLGIGLLFYFLLRTDQFIFAGAGLLFSFQLVILSAANNIKSSYIKIFLAVLLIGNFVFFSEIYFRHFQKLYGGDRGYNEFNVMNTIRDSKVKVTYLSPRDDLKMLVPYYSKYYKMPTIIFLDQVKIITKEECQKENTLCIFNEGDLNRINKNKDDSQLKPILDPAGLKIYYSL